MADPQTIEVKTKLTGDLAMPAMPIIPMISVVGSFIACLIAFGVDITPEQKAAIEDLMRNLMVAGLGDVGLRIARNYAIRR